MLEQLTKREKVLARQISLGEPYKEVARKLGLKRLSVKAMAWRIYKKLGIHNRLQLINTFYNLNIIKKELYEDTTPDVDEFIVALNRYKALSGRRYITETERIGILKRLGWEKAL